MRTEEHRGADAPGCIWEDVLIPATDYSGAGSAEHIPAEEAYQRVVRTLERDIVPRLMLVRHQSAAAQPVRVGRPIMPGSSQVEEFVGLLQSRDAGLAAAFVETLRQSGIQPHAVCLHLLAPAAARLGVLWEEDACTFMQVTLALCRLHQILHGLWAQPESDATDKPAVGMARALLVNLPGDQHTFGAMIAGHLLRRAGWDVWNEFPSSKDEILQSVSRLSYRMVGISVGSDRQLESLSSLISSIRRQSRCRNVAVVIGGAMLCRVPGLAGRVGADAAPVEADEMLQWARVQLDARSSVARKG